MWQDKPRKGWWQSPWWAVGVVAGLGLVKWLVIG